MKHIDEINAGAPAQQSGPELHRILTRRQFTLRYTGFCSCSFKSHSHPEFSVTEVLSGSMTARVGARPFQMSPGQIALTNAGQPHSAMATQAEFVSVNISPAAVSELVTEMGLTRWSDDIVFRSRLVEDPGISAILKAVRDEICRESIGQGAMLDSMVRQLIIHLLRSHLTVRQSTQIELSRAGPVDRRLRRAVEFIHDNYSSEIALDEIAAAAYLSEYHFARLFKRIIGITPHAYLANVRLDRARKLLSDTSLPISEVAARVGYQSQSHFTKVFKSVTGVTPRAYRDSSLKS